MCTSPGARRPLPVLLAVSVSLNLVYFASVGSPPVSGTSAASLGLSLGTAGLPDGPPEAADFMPTSSLRLSSGKALPADGAAPRAGADDELGANAAQPAALATEIGADGRLGAAAGAAEQKTAAADEALGASAGGELRGAAATAAPPTSSGPLLVDPTKTVQKMAEESIVWSRLGPCRFGRSLLAPWLPHGACRWDDCLRCRGGYCLLERLLMESPMPEAGDRKCSEPSGGQVSGNGSRPLVSFIWAVHNEASRAANALLCVFRTAREVPSAEFLVYDDGSTDDMTTLASLIQTLQREFGTRVVTLSSPQARSQGHTLANTDALRQAKGKYAVLLNTDMCPLPGWLGVLVRTIETFPGAGIVGPMMVSPQGRVMEMGGSVFQHGKVALREQFLAPYATTAGYLGGACMLFDRELFLSQGLFDPQFAPAYFENTDASLTMRAAGYLTVVQPLAVVVQVGGASDSTAEKAEQMRVNQLKFYNKHKDQLDLHCPPPMDVCSDQASVDRAISFETFQRQGSQVLIMDYMVPEPDKDSGSLRMYELMQIVVDLGYAVSFQPELQASHARYVVPLLAMGINVLQSGSLKSIAAELESTEGSTARTWRCPWSVVIISRRATFRKQEAHVRTLCPHVPVVFDTVDLHYIRERRSFESALATGDKTMVYVMDRFWKPDETPRVKMELLLKEGEDLEVGYMASSDLVFVVSTEEHRVASRKVGAEKVRILSNIYPEPDRERGATLEGRQGGLFVGCMCHAPNIDASKFIMREVFGPTTHDMFPRGFMHFVWSGTGRSQCNANVGDLVLLIQEAQEHPLITLHLDVSDEELAELHMKARFFLGALRVGAGVKGKLCHALLYGLPIIGSKAATEGMHAQDDEHFLAANSVKEYREQIQRLTTDADLWHRLRRNGFDLVQRHFGRGSARAILEEVFAKLGAAARVSPAAAGARRATSIWACPLQSGQKTAGSGRRSEEGRPRSKRRVSHEGSTCPYEQESTHPAIVPTMLLNDGLLVDDPSPDGASVVGKVVGAARGYCPDSTAPTTEHPFIFYHMEQCKGDALRPHILSSVATMNTSVAIPGQRALPATCSLAWDAGELAAESCGADPEFPRAGLYFGTFSPLRLGRASQGTCFVMLRDPLERAMAHFSTVVGLAESFGYGDFSNISMSRLDEAVEAVGTGLYMSRYLGCKGEDCRGKSTHRVADAARQQLGRCHVGLVSAPRETMAYLHMLLPWFNATFETLDSDHAEEEFEKKARRRWKKNRRFKLSALFQGDWFLFEQGLQAFRSQLRKAFSCYTEEKYEGDEGQLGKDVRTVTRKMIKRGMATRVRVSSCLERHKLCSGRAKEFESCRCYELVQDDDG